MSLKVACLQAERLDSRAHSRHGQDNGAKEKKDGGLCNGMIVKALEGEDCNLLSRETTELASFAKEVVVVADFYIEVNKRR